jgi:hypothetical protein
MTNRLVLAVCAMLALGSFGCSNTVRYMTATHWMTPPGAAPATPPPPVAEGQAAAPASASQRVLYVTYWEGSCSSGALGVGRGCSKGDSRVKRCTVQSDNSLACGDEKEIDKALSTSN